MAWQDLIGRGPVSRMDTGAHHAFLPLDRDEFYIVETGHVDLFAVAVDGSGNNLNRSPFVARVPVGGAFFGAHVLPTTCKGEPGILAFEAVPSVNAVLFQGKRENLASRADFDLDFVSLIDEWVAITSGFVARHEPPPPRHTLLLEADPDVRYEAHSALSVHHLEVLWVSADRPTQFIGHPEFPVAPGVTLPLSERLWLTLPKETRVSAVHTPGAIVTGKLWAALDQYNVQILRFALSVWNDRQKTDEAQYARNRLYKSQLQRAMVRDLASVLGDTRPNREAVHGYRSALHAAAAIVAESVGARFVDAPAPPDDCDLLDAARAVATPSGIRIRQIQLSAGWERRDGPSFLGIVSEEEPRPVAVVNRGHGAYEMIDPVSGDAARVNRERAESLGVRGVMFYPPLAPGVDSGLAAVLQALRGRGRDILSVGLMGGLAALIALLTPILTGQLLAEIIPRVDIPMWTAAMAALVLGAFATAVVSIVGALSMLRVEARIDETLQATVWNRLLSLPLPFFRRYLAGDLADRANGVSLIRQVLTGATSSSLVSGVFSIFSFALLFYYSWELALWTGVAALVLAGASWFFATRQIRHQRAVFTAQGAIDGLVYQMVRGLAKIRQANAELNALKNWAERYMEQRREQLSARKWAAGQLTFNALFEPLTFVALSALIWYSLIEGGTATIEGDAGNPFTLADFLSFHAALGQFVGGVVGLTTTWTTVVAILPLFERVLPIIEARPESARGSTVLRDVSGRIECEHVTFRYPSAARDTLVDVSFHIRPGEYVAFLGPSGAGKSTLYRLLLGFERPTSGSVLLDGHDLLSLDLAAMRRYLGVVLQNGQLVPDSIIRIIGGEASLTEMEAWQAVRAVGLDEDIEALPMRLNTVLSEGGAGLSGGQKQRLLVARALARKPRVLLLDEATSMLDNRTQDTIRATLRDLTATRILIAHRLSTVVDVDRIYVMQDGKIVETGSFQRLMEQGGVLAEMARRQIV